MKRRRSFASPGACGRTSERASMSEISFALLLLHRRGLVRVDEPALTLGYLCRLQFGDDLGDGRGGRFDCPGKRVTAERAKPHQAVLRIFTGFEGHAFVVH